MKSTIAKSNQYEFYYQTLGNGEDKIFDTMKDVMIFSALLAINKSKKKEPFTQKGGDSIKLEVFSQEDKTIIDLIALYEYNDISILSIDRQDEKLEIFEQYANAGMVYLESRFNHIPNEFELRKIVDEFRPEVNYSEKIDLSELIMESLK